MNYTYDHRPLIASQDDDQESPLQDLIGLLGDAIRPAEAIVTELEKDTDTDLSAALKHATEALENLRTAESVETLGDFTANVRDAAKAVQLLEPVLKKLKRDAKSDGDAAATEAIEEAIDSLRGLKRELADIEGEIEEVGSAG